MRASPFQAAPRGLRLSGILAIRTENPGARRQAVSAFKARAKTEISSWDPIALHESEDSPDLDNGLRSLTVRKRLSIPMGSPLSRNFLPGCGPSTRLSPIAPLAEAGGRAGNGPFRETTDTERRIFFHFFPSKGARTKGKKAVFPGGPGKERDLMGAGMKRPPAWKRRSRGRRAFGELGSRAMPKQIGLQHTGNSVCRAAEGPGHRSCSPFFFHGISRLHRCGLEGGPPPPPPPPVWPLAGDGACICGAENGLVGRSHRKLVFGLPGPADEVGRGRRWRANPFRPRTGARVAQVHGFAALAAMQGRR